MDCLFCKIIKGLIPSTKVYEDQKVLAFLDITPSAKIHILFIHKEHTANINAMALENPDSITDIFKAIRTYTKQENLDAKGFRVVVNTGPDSGQTVFHTHFHILAGERLASLGPFRK